MQSLTKTRIESIDIVRGIAMVLMALDHVRDFFHLGANLGDPMDLATTTGFLYFTRYITHFCAPIFILLSGTSIYLQSLRKTKKELGIFVLKRGLVLILFEWTIIALGWTFNPLFNIFPFQVIWAIGISMVILGLLILCRLPINGFLVLGLMIVCLHNLLDIPESAQGFKPNFTWDLFHYGHFAVYKLWHMHYAVIVYPFFAWTGVMMLGYCLGIFFGPNYSPIQRKKILLQIGLGLIVSFIIIRGINVYGDPHQWHTQKNIFYTLLDFFKVNKYPPSLLYVCMTIGPAIVLLALIEKIKNKFTSTISIFGRTALFYYILHIYLIHLVAAIFFFARGHTWNDVVTLGEKFPFLFIAPGEGYGLAVVYVIWLAVVLALYPICKWYDKYKTNHKNKWWLSYL